MPYTLKTNSINDYKMWLIIYKDMLIYYSKIHNVRIKSIILKKIKNYNIDQY